MVKIFYWLILGISVLMCIFYVLNAIYTTTVPYNKTSEAIILLVSSVIMGVGIFVAIKYGYHLGYAWRAIVILVATCIISIVWTFIGLLNFNGHVNWQ